MGKRQVHVTRVRKPVSAALLVLTSAAMVTLVLLLSGRVYASQSDAVSVILTGSLTRDRLLAFLMPVLANILLFVPWGFFAFIVLDRPERSRRHTYMMAFAAGLAFALAIHVWQALLPTHVTKPSDALANALGALAGAALGHLRKGVRVRFEL